MSAALDSLIDGLIDYAGMFPPAGLSLEDAARNYADYRRGPYARMLGKFVVPAERLGEVDPAWRCSAIGIPSQPVEACEVRVARAVDAGAALALIAPGVTAYFELPLDEDPAPLASGRGRAKARTGGLTPDVFPAPADLARFLSRCAAARVPFKATAGLHHPLRGLRRCTYQPDSPTALMHGFVNVFLAAALLWSGGSETAAVATLEEQSPKAFRFDESAAVWHGHRMTTAQIQEARTQFAISFGSCSFEEPIHDLQQLGWL